ncbi:zinc finger protein 271-like [Topomyia yanbarensis]|uniref:zinc finger protein 271-like n=1 Tax=Topomyia yanbarensis TaxID=2498891 RepID=UPI00273B7375|nr:zinc finger protein 271-like [Topomyia yanbarensis]XP_058820360.1 zinc finger protein 271-like [Topomyia yanbarensis]
MASDSNPRCRICLRYDVNELVSLFCTYFPQKQLVANMIRDTLRQGKLDSPHANDGLPQFVCDDCVERLNTACSFRKQCIRTNSIFRRNIFQGISIEGSEERCRLCNETDVDEFISVFCIYAGDNKLIADIIEDSIGLVRPTEHDKLPQNICTKCFEQLTTTCTFREFMLNSIMEFKEEMSELIKVEPCIDDPSTYLVEYLNQEEDGWTIPEKKRKTNPSRSRQTECEEQDPFIYLDSPDLEADRMLPLFHTTEDAEYYEQLYFDGVICCCGLLLEKEEELVKHRALYHSNKTKAWSPIKCNDCNMRFKYSLELAEHQENRNRKYYYRCKICNVLTKEKLSLELHFEFTRFHPILDLSEEERLSFDEKVETTHNADNRCCGCNLAFPDGETLFEHIKKVHQGDMEGFPRFLCLICHSSFSDKQALMKHQMAYIGTRMYECREPKCEYSTDQRTFMKKHIDAGVHLIPEPLEYLPIEPEAAEFFCCFRNCLESFATMLNLEEHVSTEHGEQQLANSYFSQDETEGVCPLCKRHFPKEESFEAHIQSQTVRNHICSFCGCKFPTRDALKHHEKRNHLASVRVTYEYPCSQCEAVFASKSSLTKHVVRVHEDTKVPYSEICETCGKGFYNKLSKKQHIINVHVTDKPFKCNLCSVGFGSRAQQQRHQLTHTGNKPYKCSYCSNAYSTSGDCNRHERAIHLNDKPFHCEMCAASFIRNRDLQLHMTVHTGKKLHACNIDDCQFSTNIAKLLKKHCSEVH